MQKLKVNHVWRNKFCHRHNKSSIYFTHLCRIFFFLFILSSSYRYFYVFFFTFFSSYRLISMIGWKRAHLKRFKRHDKREESKKKKGQVDNNKYSANTRTIFFFSLFSFASKCCVFTQLHWPVFTRCTSMMDRTVYLNPCAVEMQRVHDAMGRGKWHQSGWGTSVRGAWNAETREDETKRGETKNKNRAATSLLITWWKRSRVTGSPSKWIPSRDHFCPLSTYC